LAASGGGVVQLSGLAEAAPAAFGSISALISADAASLMEIGGAGAIAAGGVSAGEVAIDNGVSLSLASVTNSSGTFRDSLTIYAAHSIANAGSISDSGNLTLRAGTLGTAGTVTNSGGISISGSGVLSMTAQSALINGTTGINGAVVNTANIINNGSLTLTASGTYFGVGTTTVLGTVVNSGTILDFGVATIGGGKGVGGSGVIDIGPAGVLNAGYFGTGTGNTIAFTGNNARLNITAGSLDGSKHFDPVISGFNNTDVIDFIGTSTTGVVYSGDTSWRCRSPTTGRRRPKS
jgi:fibronectin-binding autotransporter adhesin